MNTWQLRNNHTGLAVGFFVNTAAQTVPAGAVIPIEQAIVCHNLQLSPAGQIQCSLPGLYTISFNLTVKGDGPVLAGLYLNNTAVPPSFTSGFNKLCSQAILDLLPGDSFSLQNCGAAALALPDLGGSPNLQLIVQQIA